MGCKASIFSNKASAGGQLEQPSEVNNSTSMGVVGALSAAARSVPDQLPLANRKATNKNMLSTPVRISSERIPNSKFGRIQICPRRAVKVGFGFKEPIFRLIQARYLEPSRQGFQSTSIPRLHLSSRSSLEHLNYRLQAPERLSPTRYIRSSPELRK